MNKTYVPSSEFTPELIAKLKVETKTEIFQLTVEDKSIIVKKPGITELDFAAQTAGNNGFDFNRTILQQCMLAGDTEVINVEAYFLGACAQLEELVKAKASELVKL